MSCLSYVTLFSLGLQIKKLDHMLLVASILCIWQIDAKKDAIRVAKKELKDAKSDYKAKHSESARR